MLRQEHDVRPRPPAAFSEWVVSPNHIEYSEPPTEVLIPPEFLGTDHVSSQEQDRSYATGFGNLTFEELYRATDRIVGFTLREKLGMTNPEDIDDCMQAGYLKVWKELQKNPNLFADKPKKYIVQAVVLRSKAQRYAHLRHYRKIVYDADVHAYRSTTTPTTHQLDTWIDLEQAIGTVGEHVAKFDTPLYAVALYALLTDVKTQDVARLFGNGVSTLTTAKRRLRATLAGELPHYGNGINTTDALSIPRLKRIKPFKRRRELTISKLLLDEPFEKTSRTPARNILTPRTRIEQPTVSEITEPSCEPTYHTQWRGAVTFEELLTDRDVRRVAFSKMRSLGYVNEDADDCFQTGSLKLWQKLTEQPHLLSDKGAGWVGVFIAHGGSHRNLWKHKARNVPIDDCLGEMDGKRTDLYPQSRPERWAGFATRVDERIDFELLMSTLAQKYDGDPLKLFALYSLTTSVKMKDVVAVAKAEKNQMVEARNVVKEDMRVLLELNAETNVADEFWTDQLERGENLDCVTRVTERVMDNQRLLLALYIVTTSAKRKDVTELFGIGITAFRKEITQIKSMLAEEFRKEKRKNNQLPTYSPPKTSERQQASDRHLGV